MPDLTCGRGCGRPKTVTCNTCRVVAMLPDSMTVFQCERGLSPYPLPTVVNVTSA